MNRTPLSFTLSNTSEPLVKLFSQSEADAEMIAFMRQEAAARLAERTLASAPLKETKLPVNEAPAKLSPEWQSVKERLKRSLAQPRPRGAIETSALAKTEVATGVIEASIDIKAPTVVTTPTLAKATVLIEKTLETALYPVGVATDFGKFPIENVLKLTEPGELLHELKALCRALVKHKNYAQIRDGYCQLSIQLNALGKLAPRFRPDLKFGAAFNDPVYKLIHRDQVVIDLHWIYATKIPVSPAESSHRLLLDASAGSGFDFDLAWALAGKSWKNDYRADEALALTIFQQCQMLKLQGKDLTIRLKAIASGRRVPGGRPVSKSATVSRLIGEWAERDRRIVPQQTLYEMLWLARELLGSDACNLQVAALHALMMGSEILAKTSIREKLSRLDKHVRLV